MEKKRASELEFIHCIRRDGLELKPVDEKWLEIMEPDTVFELRQMSTSYSTYIAFGACVYIVKLKKNEAQS